MERPDEQKWPVREQDICPGSCQRYSSCQPGRVTALNPSRCKSNDASMDPAFGGEFQPGLHVPVAKRGIANPAPLGLCAFAFTNFVMGLISVNAGGLDFPNVIIGPAFAYGGAVQFTAGMWEMAAGNTFGATAFASYGAYWVAYAIIITPNGLGVEASIKETAGTTAFLTSIGFFMMGFFIFSTILLLCSLKSSVAFFILIFCVDIAFLLLGLAYLYPQHDAANQSLLHAGGGFSLASAFLAWYNAIAGIADGSNTFFVVPVLYFPWSDRGIRDRKERDITSPVQA